MLFFVLFFCGIGVIAASFCDSDSAWNQVWADEFNQSELDNTSWSIDVGAGDSRVRNSQGTIDNVYLEGGYLVLRSQKQKLGKYNFSSGAIQSKGKRSFAPPARVCISAKLPGGGLNGTVGHGAGAGIWPAHWLMPDNGVCWPKNGEIDIMEMINGDGILHGTYHWSDTTCGANSQKGGVISMPPNWASADHEYAVEYTMDYIAFVVDGKVYSNVTSSQATMYNVPWYVILNTAVGGPKTWPGPVNPQTTILPTYHRIDYVRVAKKKSHSHA